MTDPAAMTATFDQIDELARRLYMDANATVSVLTDRTASRWWSAQDEMTRLYWREEAVRRLQQERY